MQSIFIGRVASAEYTPSRDRDGTSVLADEVSQRFEGGSQARVISDDRRETNGSIGEPARSKESRRDGAVAFPGPFEKGFPFAQEMRDHADGENRPCESVYLRRMGNEPVPDRAGAFLADVIFRNELRAWLRMHRARQPRPHH